MKIKFWGVRGSIPTPVSQAQVQKKIEAVIQKITPEDIATPETKEKFLASISQHIFGTVGGNTACVEVIGAKGEKIIIDAGTGIRSLGKKYAKNDAPIHILFSHFHWDHIQGLPFFDPIFQKNREIHFYSFSEESEEYLKKQMSSPFFPVTMDACSKNLHFHKLHNGQEFSIGNIKITTRSMEHPGGCFAYSFVEKNKKFIYSSDVEISLEDFEKNSQTEAFFNNPDIMVIDSQYTLNEAVEKKHWGHTSFCYAIDFASVWNTKKLFLFHHEPTYDDKKLYKILASARHYSSYSAHNKKMFIELSVEGKEYDV